MTLSSISPEPLNLSTSLVECSPSVQHVQTLTHCRTLKTFLTVPEHQLKHPLFGSKTSARVLSSSENIRILDEKAKKGNKKIEMKSGNSSKKRFFLHISANNFTSPEICGHGHNYSIYNVTLTPCMSMVKCMGSVECLDLAPSLEVPGHWIHDANLTFRSSAYCLLDGNN